MTADQPHEERPPSESPSGEVDEPQVAEPTESSLAGGEAGSAGEAAGTAGTTGSGEAAEAGAADEAGTGQAVADELAVTRMELAERTADLQRLQAEFVNYKRRVERDRELLAQNASYKVLAPVVEVLDTIDRAREHAPLEGGLKAVADQLERVVGAQGLTKFAEPGDAFDPNLHEALSTMGSDPEVTVPTVKVVAKAGYRIGERVVRAAQVLVVDPE